MESFLTFCVRFGHLTLPSFLGRLASQSKLSPFSSVLDNSCLLFNFFPIPIAIGRSRVRTFYFVYSLHVLAAKKCKETWVFFYLQSNSLDPFDFCNDIEIIDCNDIIAA